MRGVVMYAELARIPLADGTLVATPGPPTPDLLPSLMAASDVLGTGWFAAVAAETGPGKTVAVVGDGAVGLLGVLAAKQLCADRIIAFSGTPTARPSPESLARGHRRRTWSGRRRHTGRRALQVGRPHPRRSSPRPAVSASSRPADLGPKDQSRQGIRPQPPSRAGSRGLPGHGPAHRDQGPADPMTPDVRRIL
jgi:hypothetical protein